MSSMENSGRIAWLFNRLRCMSIPELVYRVEQALSLRALRFGLVSLSGPPARPVAGQAPRAGTCLTGVEPSRYIAEADDILSGKVKLFRQEFDIGSSPEWNRDPLTGVLGPLSFGPALMLTDRSLVGDIKHVWELNRHAHLVRLAQAYALTGESRFLSSLGVQIRSWLAQCPPPKGPNWTSALELAMRLINWSMVWRLVGAWESPLFDGEAGRRLRAEWLASIHAHADFIRRNLSRHSSANNHLVGELAGLYVAGRTWPYWAAANRWFEQARLELEREAVLQYSAEGAHREQAFSYHVFVSEFLFAAGFAAQRSGDAFSPQFWAILGAAARFLAAVRDVAGHVPMVGDADDGAVFRLDPVADEDRPALLLALADFLGGQFPDRPAPDTVTWLLGDAPRPPFPVPTTPAGAWRFPDAGYFVFGSNFGTNSEIKGLVDCGPLGYLGIAAHGHADALAIVLSVRGEQCLVDPGTFSYHREIRWRDYFRGTSAHNTLQVDGLNQSVSGGRFMWTRKARAFVALLPGSPGNFDFEGWHDGYTRLRDPVQHRRAVRFDEHCRELIVRDSVSATEEHEIAQFWHFAPELDVRLEGGGLLVLGRAFRMQVEFSGEGLELALYRASEDPPLGWYSSSYESKQPCATVRARCRTRAGGIAVRFRIEFRGRD